MSIRFLAVHKYMVSNLTIPGADQRGLDRQKPFPDYNNIIYTQRSANIGKYSHFEAEVFGFSIIE